MALDALPDHRVQPVFAVGSFPSVLFLALRSLFLRQLFPQLPHVLNLLANKKTVRQIGYRTAFYRGCAIPFAGSETRAPRFTTSILPDPAGLDPAERSLARFGWCQLDPPRR